MSSPTLAPHNESTVPRARQRELWQRYQKAKSRAPIEAELIQQYLPLVKTVVGRVAMTLPAHVDLDDLYSAGTIGLLNAVRNFDAANGAGFETYAHIRIRGAVLDELRRMDWAPRPMREKARKIQGIMQRLEQAKGALPTEEEMAQAMNLPLTDYLHLLEEIKPVVFVCLDIASGSEGEGSMEQYESVADASQESPVDGASRRELTQLIVERLQQLPEMQRKVLALYYFEDLRLREIAEAFGLTESRICQIHAQAILAIKAYLKEYET